MRGVFRWSGSWNIVEGNSGTPLPRPTAAATGEDLPTIQAAWDEKNDKALGLMTIYISSSLQFLIGNTTTAAAAWKAIKDQYAKPGAVGAFVYFQQLFNTRFDDAQPLCPQITALEEIRSRTVDAGIAISDQFAALIIVNALPNSYQTIASTLLATVTDLSTLKPADVIPKIIEEEARRQASKNANVSRVLSTTRLPKKCNICGKTNHSTENHWPDGKPPQKGNKQGKGKGKQGGNQGGNNKGSGQNHGQNNGNNGASQGQGQNSGAKVNNLLIESVPDVTVASSSSKSIDLSLYHVGDEIARWMVDSGCTSHVTNVFEDFDHYHEFPVPGHAHLAGADKTIDIKGVGIVLLRHQNSDRIIVNLTLKSVLYIPEASHRFFAPRTIIDQGGCYSAHGDTMNFWAGSKPGENLILTARSSHDGSGFYWLETKVFHPNTRPQTLQSVEADYDLWHQRFGHAGFVNCLIMLMAHQIVFLQHQSLILVLVVRLANPTDNRSHSLLLAPLNHWNLFTQISSRCHLYPLMVSNIVSHFSTTSPHSVSCITLSGNLMLSPALKVIEHGGKLSFLRDLSVSALTEEENLWVKSSHNIYMKMVLSVRRLCHTVHNRMDVQNVGSKLL